MNNEYLSLIENALKKYLYCGVKRGDLLSAMEYTLLAAGKRIRPMLALKFCEACGGDVEKALPLACSLEMIHTYSLIHDDLPCMDNDDFRRGKPSCHVKFGEAMAILAGDALLNLAYEILFSEDTVALLGADKIVKSARILSYCSGEQGMIGGQVIDLKSENIKINEATLNEMYLKKTAMLIMAAAQLGCVAANAGNDKIMAAQNYAKYIGLAFQIKDDILDVLYEKTVTGKSSSDIFNGKSTFVSVLGLDKAQKEIKTLTDNAICELAIFGDSKVWLENFALSLESRTK